MGQATYAIQHFLGGEVSQFAQGRFDKPDYRTSLNVCFNAFPAEIGPWVRRPGTVFAGTTRGGAPGRVGKFDFDQATPYTLEFTDGFLRFRSGPTLITSNDAKSIAAISTANPAVVETSTAHDWTTGDTVVIGDLGATAPLLQNRQFLATVVDATHLSLVDAISGETIDGSTLGAIAADATISRVFELATAYVGAAWLNLRAVQAETTAILLCGTVAPQVLTVTTPPSAGINAVFGLGAAVFNDGPYLDPFTNGVLATPSATSGIVNIALSFPVYSSTKAYAVGSFVTSAGINYISLLDQNVNNTPAASPTYWSPTSASDAIGPNGFQGSDVGRLVRLFSEPPAWDIATGYGTGNVVSYNPSGIPGATTYWQAQGSTTGDAPGADLTNWSIIAQGAAIWTWGRITSLSTIIDRALAGSSSIGDMIYFGGLTAPFNGTFSQPPLSCAEASTTGGLFLVGQTITLASYVGKNYGASPQQISQATVYPSTSAGFAVGSFNTGTGSYPFAVFVTLNLRASNVLPTSSADGTLLGTTGLINNTASAVTIQSNDSVTSWNYVWVEVIFSELGTGTTNPIAVSWQMQTFISQISFFGPPGTGTSVGVNVEILGPPLLYTSGIATWRLGVYSDTTGWPTCGTYHEGRLWLGGAVANRFDACVSNGIVGNTVNFAPTDQYGVVAGSSAISYVLNSDSSNPIFWFQPDLQGVLIGTQAGEWLVQAPTAGPISPANIAARRVTKIGCAFVEPCRTEHTNVFVQRFSVKLMEGFSDVYSGKFSAPNIADKAQHITRAGIAEMAYQQATTPIIWGRDTAGALFGVTYKRDTLTTSQGPTFNGWHRHALGSGRNVESLCAGPSVGGNLDTLTMVTNDVTTNIRHVELLTDTMDEASPLTSAWFLDDAVAPTSTDTTDTPSGGAPYGGMTLNGLWHLNGQTVQVFAGGLDCGDLGNCAVWSSATTYAQYQQVKGSDGNSYVSQIASNLNHNPVGDNGTNWRSDYLVSNGSIFVPYGDGVSAGTGGGLFTAAYATSISPFPIVVGFTYNSDGQMVRPISIADTGARFGPALGETRRNHRYAMLLNNTLGLSVGGSSFANLKPALFRQAGGTAIAALTTFSGVHQDSLTDDYSYEGMISWRVSRPFPANVVAISGNISTKDQ